MWVLNMHTFTHGPDRLRDRVHGLCYSDARTEMSGVGMDTEGPKRGR